MQTSLLIDAIVQRTMVFIAQLATAGGVRAPLAHVANQVFLDLSEELQNQGVKKKVIADMFGMALRTYHRRLRELQDSRSEVGRTLWEAVLSYLGEHQPLSAAKVLSRFRHDDPELVSGVLNDLVHSQLAYRSGRGATAVYRLADTADFDSADPGRREANMYLVWLTVYREGPLTLQRLSELLQLPTDACCIELKQLAADGRITLHPETPGGGAVTYSSESIAVPMGESKGWEAAVLDHYQAMLSAVSAKLAGGLGHAGPADTLGGSTWSLNIWSGHPYEAEAKGTLSRLRGELSALRKRIDEYNTSAAYSERQQVIVYLGQYIRGEEPENET